MDAKESQQRRIQPKVILAALLFVVFVITLVVVLHPDLRNSLRTRWTQQSRQVLSTVTGNLMHDGARIKVIKLKTNEGIFLEFYGSGDGHVRPLVDRIKLPDRRDGFIHLNEQATNLAVDDVDGDGFLEVIAPTFDEELVAHLNVFRYNAESERFEPVLP